MKIIQNMKVKAADFRGIGIQMSRLETRKNASSAMKMDKFVIRSTRLENLNNNQVESSPEKNESLECSAEKDTSSRVFDESEYDVSFSQVKLYK